MAKPRTRFLPEGFRPDPWRMGLFAASMLVAIAIFVLFGSDSEVGGKPMSIFSWIYGQWNAQNASFAHNGLMLLVSAYVVWLNREKLAAAEPRPCIWGILVIVASLLLHVIGYRSQLPRLSLAATVGVFWGIPFAIWGRETAKLLLFPAGYALLCFTNSILVETTMPLRLAASTIAVGLLHGVGIDAVQNGTVVLSNAGGGFQFDVADACSGLRSLVVMTALAAPYAYFTLSTPWKRIVLFALSVPLAMLANSLRIFTIGAVAEWIGQKLAMQLYHDLSGYLVFFLSIALLILAGKLLDRDWKSTLCALRPEKSSPAR